MNGKVKPTKSVVRQSAKGSSDRELQRHIAALKESADRLRQFVTSDANVFESCVRASFAKSFDFAELAYASYLTEENAFYCSGSLRGICEDLIILKYISTWNAIDRDRVLTIDMSLSTNERVAQQSAFFSRFRFGQPIYSKVLSNELRQTFTEERTQLWRRYGFPRLGVGRPSTRVMAEKIGSGAVDVLYDYIFRVTSSTVHFNPSLLLRMGWGVRDNSGELDLTFSTKHMGRYELAFCQIYSALLLTIYFEFSPDFLMLRSNEISHLEGLRFALSMVARWPEMVTFEEMNHLVPPLDVFNETFRRALARKFQDGFVNSV